MRVQGLSVVFDILPTDVQHVHLRTGDHDPDQGCVLGTSSLKMSIDVSELFHVGLIFSVNTDTLTYLHGFVESLSEVGWGVLNTLD